MQDQITALQPQLTKKAQEIEQLMVVIESETVDVESQKEVINNFLLLFTGTHLQKKIFQIKGEMSGHNRY